MATRTGNALSAIVAMVLALTSIGAQAESHVRIIRLSYIDGTVQMDRATGEGLEKAILNTPVTEGVRLVTGNDGLAEVEFENNTTIRLGENSELHFSKLVVDDSGAKVNEVELVKGTAYFDTKGGKEDIYRAAVGNSVFLVHRDTQLRLSDDDGNPKISVLKGEVELQTPQREVKVGKKETLTVDPNDASGYQIAKGVDEQPLDRWNDERSAYQTAYAYNNSGVGPNVNGYGYSDLNYYGGWSYLQGVGYGWQPYGVGSWGGWDPYLAGAWAFYPGFGYTWASAYPWGWLPYHYGSWTYYGNAGWFWIPGNFYRNRGWWGGNNFHPVPVVHGPNGWAPPVRPPVAAVGAPGFSPTVKVGTIGNMPPAIPGGRVPPNFRSVVPARTVVPATAAPRATDRAMNVPGRVGAPYVPPTANKVGQSPTAAGVSAHPVYSPSAAHNGQPSGHVFAPPVRTVSPGSAGYGMGGGYNAAGHPGYGAASGPSMGGAHAMGPAPGMGSSHAMGPSGGHGGGSHGSSSGPSPR